MYIQHVRWNVDSIAANFAHAGCADKTQKTSNLVIRAIERGARLGRGKVVKIAAETKLDVYPLRQPQILLDAHSSAGA